ncbi:hypothetical protein ACOTEZ_06380, partial [Achromobacter xylosoxidans]
QEIHLHQQRRAAHELDHEGRGQGQHRQARATEIFTLMLLLYFAVALLITAGVRLLERRVRVR